MENKRFNIELMLCIETEHDSYITKMCDKHSKFKNEICASLFETTQPKFEYVHKVICAHLTFITKMLYEIDLGEFRHASK
jgi:hypothetical protein